MQPIIVIFSEITKTVDSILPSHYKLSTVH